MLRLVIGISHIQKPTDPPARQGGNSKLGGNIEFWEEKYWRKKFIRPFREGVYQENCRGNS